MWPRMASNLRVILPQLPRTGITHVDMNIITPQGLMQEHLPSPPALSALMGLKRECGKAEDWEELQTCSDGKGNSNLGERRAQAQRRKEEELSESILFKHWVKTD